MADAMKLVPVPRIKPEIVARLLDFAEVHAQSEDEQDREEAAAIAVICARMNAAPVLPEKLQDWEIDTSTGTEILVYKNCSVFEDDQARLVLSLLCQTIAASPPAREEAPAEGAGEREQVIAAMSVELEKHEWFKGSAVAALVWASRLYDATDHLRARTSEPAREAVACPACLGTWGECNTCGGSHKKDPRWIAAHPAPATADKLREAAGLLNDCIWLDTDTGDYRVEHDGSVEKARAILATLNEQPQ